MGRPPKYSLPEADTTPKKERLSLSQLAAYDDVLTDALVDHVYFWTIILKNRSKYTSARGISEDEVCKILQEDVVLAKDVAAAAAHLLDLPVLKRYYTSLRSPREQADFQKHMKKYLEIWLPDCPFEVSTTNRYTITTEEASTTARRRIRAGETIKYLCGNLVAMTPEEEEELHLNRQDFSVVISSRKKTPSLFLGPARFANHDCKANGRLVSKGTEGMTIIADRDIEKGEEINVDYGRDYFGEGNCECLCASCEKAVAGGWAPKEVKDSESTRSDSADDTDSSTESTTESSSNKRRAEDVDSDSSEDIISPVRKRGRLSLSQRSELTLPSPPESAAKVSEEESEDEAPAPTISASASESEEEAEDSDAAAQSESHTSEEFSSGEPLPWWIPADAMQNAVDENAEPTAMQSMHAWMMECVSPPDESENLTRLSEGLSDSDIANDLFLLSMHNAAKLSARMAKHAGRGRHLLNATSNGPAEDKPARRVFSAIRPTAPPADSVDQPEPMERSPGDYIRTSLLLVLDESRWVDCRTCEQTWVQRSGSQTRKECPRCERHSKLFGYQWPKTETARGEPDTRVLDHRLVHRFLTNAEEREEKKKGRGLIKPDENPAQSFTAMDVPFNLRRRSSQQNLRGSSASTPSRELSAQEKAEESMKAYIARKRRGRPPKVLVEVLAGNRLEAMK